MQTIGSGARGWVAGVTAVEINAWPEVPVATRSSFARDFAFIAPLTLQPRVLDVTSRHPDAHAAGNPRQKHVTRQQGKRRTLVVTGLAGLFTA